MKEHNHIHTKEGQNWSLVMMKWRKIIIQIRNVSNEQYEIGMCYLVNEDFLKVRHRSVKGRIKHIFEQSLRSEISRSST